MDHPTLPRPPNPHLETLNRCCHHIVDEGLRGGNPTKRLRLRLFAIAVHLATRATQLFHRLAGHSSWTKLTVTALTRLTALPAVLP